MRAILIRLNGWMRLYVVLAIAIFVLTAVSVQKPDFGYVYLGEFLPKLPERPCVPEYQGDCDSDMRFLRDFQFQKKYEISDDISVTEDERYTSEQVMEAYKLAKAKADKAYRSKVIEVYLNAFYGYLVAMISLYAIGWAIAWIRRGFKK
jgi:hypothetical protein